MFVNKQDRIINLKDIVLVSKQDKNSKFRIDKDFTKNLMIHITE